MAGLLASADLCKAWRTGAAVGAECVDTERPVVAGGQAQPALVNILAAPRARLQSEPELARRLAPVAAVHQYSSIEDERTGLVLLRPAHGVATNLSRLTNRLSLALVHIEAAAGRVGLEAGGTGRPSALPRHLDRTLVNSITRPRCRGTAHPPAEPAGLSMSLC